MDVNRSFQVNHGPIPECFVSYGSVLGEFFATYCPLFVQPLELAEVTETGPAMHRERRRRPLTSKVIMHTSSC